MTVDTRFFEPLKVPTTLGEIAELTGADLRGEASLKVTGIAAATNAGRGDICFYEGPAKDASAVAPHAAACFVKPDAAGNLPGSVIALVSKMPRFDHVCTSRSMFRPRNWNDEGAAPEVHESARIAPGAVICAGAAIGAESSIGPNSVIGPGVQVGQHCNIGANTSIRCALIGNHVTILSGARIGESGFGVIGGPEGAEDVPQWGRVILQDKVLVGANTCIDRGAFADTVIGERTKLDNLCQIGHNVVLGRNVLMASFTGLSGSVNIGDNVRMGGRVGIADHVKVGDGAQLAASAGVFRDIPAGETWGGTPAKPLRQFLRETAWLQKQAMSRKTPT